MDQLTERMDELTERVNQLAEAQRLTKERLQKLIGDHRKTREHLQGLSDTLGYVLEDRALRGLPKILKERYGLEVVGALRRTHLRRGNRYIKVNIYGEVRRNGESLILIGEAKSRISKRAVDAFLKKCQQVGGKQVRVFVGYLIPPSLEPYLQEHGILYIPSYELPLA